MNSINTLFDEEITLTQILDKRNDRIERWLNDLQSIRSKNFNKQIYDAVKNYSAKSYYFDYCGIKNDQNGNNFFDILKPRLRHRLVSQLFNQFLTRFYYMFYDDWFEAGVEFKNDFISNIYSRLYLPKHQIVGEGENFCEIMMIQQGVVNLYLNYKDNYQDIDHDFKFFILPTYSYFGDYQILYNLRSQIIYKADESCLLVCLCIKKSTFLKIMENYPDAREFYMTRSWDRRKEMRRRQKKFIIGM